MSDPRLFRLRITYGKTGRLAMLSHLELSRALERAVRRSGLPFAITNGFSPHMRIAFGAALPVGVGGEAEIYDLFLTDYVNPDKALDALRYVSTADLMPFAAEYVERDAIAASVALPVSTYLAIFNDEISALNIPTTITVVRKKKEKILDVADFLIDAPIVSGKNVQFSLLAKDSGSLRPDLFLDECLKLTYLQNLNLEYGKDTQGHISDTLNLFVPELISLTRIAQNC